MIIIDKALQRRKAEGRPVRVGLIGAGFMAQGIALQLERYVPGMLLVGVAARQHARAATMLATVSDRVISKADSEQAILASVSAGSIAICEDAAMLCRSDAVDVIVEVTGAIDYGARVTLAAIKAGKHVVLMNAELDATVGPILKQYADSAGVVLTNADGDQPGVIGNLYRFVAGMGLEPVVAGNIKGLQDPYRNPTTQEGFAKRWRQQPHVVTSFADGSKISFEQAIVANAFDMRVSCRGMHGPTVPESTEVRDVLDYYPTDWLDGGGRFVDYVVGARPAPGVFVIGKHEDPLQQHYMNYYKMGEGPYYCFYTPYHLCHLEVHNTIARAALFDDAALAPQTLCVDVVATAKTALKAGETIDGIGGYMTYGQCENADTSAQLRLLPLGVAQGCTLAKPVAQDATLTYDDVVLPSGRLVDDLRREQSALSAANYV